MIYSVYRFRDFLHGGYGATIILNLPTIHKKVRVLADWIIDIFFKRDVTMLEALAEKQEKEKQNVKSTKTVGH